MGRRVRVRLLIAPTGGGKTLAGFMATLNELAEPHEATAFTRFIFHHLKALAVDIARNLEKPVMEMALAHHHRNPHR